MKFLRTVLSLLLIVPIISLVSCNKPTADLNIWFATDTHYLSPKLEGGENFIKTVSAADGKVTHYSSEVFDALIDNAKTNMPDILILGGDITLNGAVQSHEEVIEKLNALQNEGVQVLVIPGNHDINPYAIDFSGEEAAETEAYSAEAFAKNYESFGYSQAISRDKFSFSYIYEAEDNLRIVMLDTNSLGKGYVDDTTLEWLEAELKAAKKAKAKIISVTHQNLFEHNELLSFGYQLYNADKLTQLYKEYGVRCNFSGHIHIQSILKVDSVTEIVTSALPTTYIQYGKVHFDGKAVKYSAEKLDVSSYAKKSGYNDENLQNFEEYSLNFFEDTARNQVISSFEGSALSEKDINLLAETFAKINSAYFAGISVNEADFKEGVALWQKQEGFVSRYIETMLNAPENCREATVKMR